MALRKRSSSDGMPFNSENLGEEIRSRLLAIERKLEALPGQLGVIGRPLAASDVSSGSKVDAEVIDTLHTVKDLRVSAGGQAISHPHQPMLDESTFSDDAGDVLLGNDSLPSEAAVVRQFTLTSEQSLCEPDSPVNKGVYEKMDVWREGDLRRTSKSGIIVAAVQEKTGAGRFCSQLGGLRTETLKEAKPPMYHWVHNIVFELGTSLVIIINAVFVGYSGTVHLRASAFGESRNEWLDYIELGFCIWFTFELLCRLFCERPRLFIVGENWHWNSLDSLIVACSLADVFISGVASSGSMTAVTIGRMLRLSRCLRIFRLTRVMRNVSSLRAIIHAIMTTIPNLIWCLSVIGFIIYMFAVLLVAGLAEHFQSAGPDDDSTLLKDAYGGGVHTVCVVLFQSICGGIDWAISFDLWVQVGPIYGWIFLCYIFFMHFGVLNVVISIFVRATMDAVSRDREKFVQSQAENMEDYVRKVTQFFKEADIDGSGTLSWEEFKDHMANPHVRAYLQALELDVSQAHKLFELLDSDGDNNVSLDEFLNGCMRLRGGASNVDLNVILMNTERLTAQMRELRKKNHLQLTLLRAMSQPPSSHSPSKQNVRLVRSATELQ